MAAGLAHEVKNPLSTMSVNLQLLAEDFADPQSEVEERTLRRARLLLGEVRRLDGIVKDFLELARGYEISLQSVDVGLVVGELVRLQEPECGQLGIAISADLDPEARHVVADPKWLRVALLNLIVNARQALVGDAAVEAADEAADDSAPGDAAPRGRIEIVTRLKDDMVQIQVADDGPGIPADKLEKVFMPFWSSKSEGTGLGLSMTRRIVEEFGGEVTVRSQEGHGTRFLVSVPKTPRALPGGDGRDGDGRDTDDDGEAGT